MRLLLGFIILASSLLAKTYTLTTSDWMPFVDVNDPQNGVINQIIHAAFEKMDANYSVIQHPWKRGYLMTERALIDATYPYVKNQEREQKMLFSDPIYVSKQAFFYADPQMASADISTTELLKQYRICGVLGYWYENILMQEKYQVIFTADEKSSFTSLASGYCDFAMNNEVVGHHLIRNKLPALKGLIGSKPGVHLDPKRNNFLYLITSKKHPRGYRFLKEFNRALKTIKQNGTYDDIIYDFMLSLRQNH